MYEKCEARQMPSKKVTIRIDLKGAEAEDFTDIKEERGLKNNSEVVRVLVKEEAKRQKSEQTQQTNLSAGP